MSRTELPKLAVYYSLVSDKSKNINELLKGALKTNGKVKIVTDLLDRIGFDYSGSVHELFLRENGSSSAGLS